MSTRQSLLKRFDELIEFGKSLPRYLNSSSLEELAKKQRWQTSCLYILGRTFGKESTYYETFQAILKYGNLQAHITHGLALLEGAREEIEKGFLYKIEHLISVDFFDSILEQAQYLLDKGFKDVAAILGRVVIENTLKDIAKRENFTFSNEIKPSKLNETLWKNGIYAKNVWRSIQAQIDLGNFAAHGDFDKYDDNSVKNMLNWIKDVLLNL